MKMSDKLKAAEQPENCVFSKEDRKYFADPRWKEAKKLASESNFAECQKIVEQIDRDFGKIY